MAICTTLHQILFTGSGHRWEWFSPGNGEGPAGTRLVGSTSAIRHGEAEVGGLFVSRETLAIQRASKRRSGSGRRR